MFLTCFSLCLRSIILSKLTLRNTSETFYIWEDPPISPHLKVRKLSEYSLAIHFYADVVRIRILEFFNYVGPEKWGGPSWIQIYRLWTIKILRTPLDLDPANDPTRSLYGIIMGDHTGTVFGTILRTRLDPANWSNRDCIQIRPDLAKRSGPDWIRIQQHCFTIKASFRLCTMQYAALNRIGPCIYIIRGHLAPPNTCQQKKKKQHYFHLLQLRWSRNQYY